MHIGEAARRLSVTPRYIRMLEMAGRIPQARRDLNGRIYSEFDIVLLRRIGVRSRPEKGKPVSASSAVAASSRPKRYLKASSSSL